MGKPIPFSSVYTPGLRFLVDGEQLNKMFIEGKNTKVSPKQHTAQYVQRSENKQVAMYSLKKGKKGLVFHLEKTGKLHFQLEIYTYEEFRKANILRPAELKRFSGEPPIILNGI